MDCEESRIASVTEFMTSDKLQNLCYPYSLFSTMQFDADEWYIWELTPLFGRVESEPILVNGPLGSIAYISCLRTLDGSRMCGHCLGRIQTGVEQKRTLTVYELLSENEDNWDVLYFDESFTSKMRWQFPLGYAFCEDGILPSATTYFLRMFPRSAFESVLRSIEEMTPYSCANPFLHRFDPQYYAFRPDPHAERMERLKIDVAAIPFA